MFTHGKGFIFLLGGVILKDLKNKKMILELYRYNINYHSEYTDEYKKILKEFNQKRDEIDKILTIEQKEILEELFEMRGKLEGELEKQRFIEGFSMAVKVIFEGLGKDIDI